MDGPKAPVFSEAKGSKIYRSVRDCHLCPFEVSASLTADTASERHKMMFAGAEVPVQEASQSKQDRT